MLKELLRPEIDEMIEGRLWTQLSEALDEWEPAEIADLLESIEPQPRSLVFLSLPRKLAHQVFAYLESPQQESLLRDLTSEQTRELLSGLPPDDRAALLTELPANVTQRLLELLNPDDAAETRKLLGYPEESIGRLMTPDFVAVQAQWTIQQALDHIRRYGHDAETVNVIYVVDEDHHLVDDLRLRQIFLGNPEDPVSSLMDRSFVRLSARDDREEAVRAMQEYDRSALPVTDSDGVLVGIVTVDDVIDVAFEEATEDFQKMGGLEALDEPYMHTGFWSLIRKRGIWLSVLFVGEMLTTNAMAHFEDQIARAVVLAMFVPLIISSGGNSGSQATSLIIRAMAVREVGLRDWWRVLRREVGVGVTLGFLLGLVALLRFGLGELLGWQTLGPHHSMIALTVFLSLIGVVLLGTLAGSMLPFILRRIGLDPASASAPFVATLVDVTGLILYFSIAGALLRGTLL